MERGDGERVGEGVLRELRESIGTTADRNLEEVWTEQWAGRSVKKNGGSGRCQGRGGGEECAEECEEWSTGAGMRALISPGGARLRLIALALLVLWLVVVRVQNPQLHLSRAP